VQGQRASLVLEQRTRRQRDHGGESFTCDAERGRVRRGEVDGTRRVASLDPVQSGRRPPVRRKQRVERRDRAAAHECERATQRVARGGEQLLERVLDADRVGRGCDVEQGAVHVEEQAPRRRRRVRWRGDGMAHGRCCGRQGFLPALAKLARVGAAEFVACAHCAPHWTNAAPERASSSCDALV